MNKYRNIQQNYSNSQTTGRFGWLLCALVCLMFTRSASARDWYLMLVPEPTLHQQEIAEGELGPLADYYANIEKGLAISLSRSLEKLIDREKVFVKCLQYLCAEPDIQSLASKLKENSPEVHLIVLYSVGGADEPVLYVRLLDPLSLQVLFTDSLRLIDTPSAQTFTTLGQDMGSLIEARLSGTQPQSQFTLYFNDFLFDELNGLPTMVLAYSQNTQLVLTQSSIEYFVLARYFGLSSTEYKLVTSYNASQVKQMLSQFFSQKNVPTDIGFVKSQRDEMIFTVERTGNPYMPSLLTTGSLAIIVLVAIRLFVRRIQLNAQLINFANKRDADSWLITYKNASLTIYGLQSKWISQASYWRSLQKESNDYSSQAKLYYDAGDLNTTKFLLSKALHANVANAQANKLVKAIEKIEANEKSFSDNEQWIRNKLAKAMNSYRQQQPIKALALLYQGLNAAQKDTALKKQSKAIKKLIKQINKESEQVVESVVISLAKDTESTLLCHNEVVHVGRRPTNDDQTWISKQDAVFYINHKSVSRAGQHGFVQMQPSGFYWVDNQSKNGTYINQQKVVAHQPTKLNNSDTLSLGGISPLLSVALGLELSPNERILQMSIMSLAGTLSDKQALNKVWPDNALASRTKLVCVQTESYIVLNIVTNKVHICEREQAMSYATQGNRKGSKHKKFVCLCKLELGAMACITPMESGLKKQQLKLDSHPLLGKVPLVVPCQLSYGDASIQIAAYDSTSIRYTQAPFLPSDKTTDEWSQSTHDLGE